ncbi:hypothetical protein PFICI_04689 [Pestalotiopsis fici W106-1]|uniref:Major facilitator superfamily (MFS) profile domain-containing protein n=1 Tax=Pestalotiopsis fici (strain W106-1 / CGMCC3.15140) TaxID=1229662 RepID=W3X9M7_PESFW|nr:uncharacterized protein PFICI_04689 [Pestalotiopsis fici W106-1]ETS82813.1 hypothetical protein PFICI_04689 [Pestalotiopsis fici W106-1]
MEGHDLDTLQDQSEPTRGISQHDDHDDTGDLEHQYHAKTRTVDNGAATNGLFASQASLRAMRRIRSNNGHGCADLHHDADETEADGAEKTDTERFLVRWDGDKDPFCPRSRSLLHRWIIVIIVGMGSLCVTCASSIYTSTYHQITAEFEISTIVATLGLSTFVLGLSLGPLLLSPLSEFYGRRPIYIASWAIFLIWLIPSAVAKNAETTIIARFFDGFAGSAFLSVSGGTVSDLFRPDAIQAPMIIISMSPFIGPSLGPLLGGFINYNVNWRWTFYFMLIWAGVMMVCIFVLVPETYHPIKLREKARHLRKTTENSRWKSPMELSQKSILQSITRSFSRPFQLLIYEPICLLLCLYSAILLGILYLFFGAFSLVFGNVYGFSLWQIGLAFMGIFTGMIAASATKPVWHRIHMRLLERNGGVSEPEFQLPSAVAGGVLVPIGLFWFAWTIYAQVHWIVPIIGSGVFGMGTLLVFTGIFTFLVDAYPAFAASALAANTFTRCAFAAAFPLFGLQMYNKLGYHWASSLLAFLTATMMPFPWLFFRYGKQLRKRSRFAEA